MSSIVIKGNTSGQVEIAAPDVAGSTTLTLPANTGNIVTTGDSGTITQGMIGSGAVTQAKLGSGVAGTGPAFSAYPSSSQSINANTATKIQFNTEAFDTANCFDTTNYRFIPNVAGYYQINALITFGGTVALYTVIVLYKNGSQIYAANNQRSNGNYNCINLNELVYMNGTTDYLEIYGYEQSNTATVASVAIQNKFSGFLVRAA